jgi:5,6,7,8-tetrahydromethanopterin hydro-lyase
LEQRGRRGTTFFSPMLNNARGVADDGAAVMMRVFGPVRARNGNELMTSPPAACDTTPNDQRQLRRTQSMASEIVINIGEALVGEGNEIAHIDLMIGTKTGPVGQAFANALANQSAGHTNLLAVLTPNLVAKPATVLVTKVTIKGMKQAVQMFGPAQYAVAKAVTDCVAEGTIPLAQADDLVIVCGVFIHPGAEDNAKILKFNYEATKLSIERAMKSLPTPQEIVSQKDTAKHPFA